MGRRVEHRRQYRAQQDRHTERDDQDTRTHVVYGAAGGQLRCRRGDQANRAIQAHGRLALRQAIDQQGEHQARGAPSRGGKVTHGAQRQYVGAAQQAAIPGDVPAAPPSLGRCRFGLHDRLTGQPPQGGERDEHQQPPGRKANRMKTGECSRQAGRIRPEGLTGRASQEIRGGGGAQPLHRTDCKQVALAAGRDKAGGRSGDDRQRQEVPRRLGDDEERAANRQDEADHERRPATDAVRHHSADQGEDGAAPHLDRVHGRREAWRLPEKPVHVGREERLRWRRGDAGGKDEADEDDGARRPERRRGLGVTGCAGGG